MRFRLAPLLTLAVAAPALATTPAHAARFDLTQLKVRACETGDSAKERHATFYARMRALPGTARMLMRFTLVDRSGDGQKTLDVPALEHWRRSRPGVRSFGYAQTVTGLQPGAYAVVVEFRWVGSGGRVIRSLRRTSAECREDGKLPNLAITRIASRFGDAPGTEQYDVRVVNRGAGDAREFDVDLFVDGAATDADHVHLLEPGESTVETFSGPVCTRGIRAAVDRADDVNEANEDDNVLRVRCPAPSF